jgi:hypothetical protein
MVTNRVNIKQILIILVVVVLGLAILWIGVDIIYKAEAIRDVRDPCGACIDLGYEVRQRQTPLLNLSEIEIKK